VCAPITARAIELRVTRRSVDHRVGSDPPVGRGRVIGVIRGATSASPATADRKRYEQHQKSHDSRSIDSHMFRVHCDPLGADAAASSLRPWAGLRHVLRSCVDTAGGGE